MKMRKLHIAVAFVCALLTSCEYLVDITTDDAVGTLNYDFKQPVSEIFVLEDMDIELIESEDNSLTIKGAQAILDQFEVTENKELLSLNFNKMGAWKYDKPLVQIRTPENIKMFLKAHNNVFANDTLRMNRIYIDNDGTGDVRLKVNCQHFVSIGTLIGLSYIEGQTDSLIVNNKYSSGFRGANLEATHVLLFSEASNYQVVHPVKTLDCLIGQSGNVYYVNEPETLEANYFGNKSGRLIFDATKE